MLRLWEMATEFITGPVVQKYLPFLKPRPMTEFRCKFLGFPLYTMEMKPEEACKILNIDKDNINLEEVQKRAVTIYDLNSPENGGSFYIQIKALNAYKTSLIMLKQMGHKENEFFEMRERFHEKNKESSKPDNNQIVI